jgi:DNA-binding winged helix-turn-helix (wHTH) protein/tetratricopeptide (TPR) repeat protein
MTKPVKHFYEFGSFRVDVLNRLLLREGELLPVTPKAVETLLALIDESGEVLSREDLMKFVWPDSAVEDGSLTQNIYLLRKYLGKAPGGLSYIETVPRRGYRFVGEVRRLAYTGQSPDARQSTVEGADLVAPERDKDHPMPVTEPGVNSAGEAVLTGGRLTRQRWLGGLADLVALVLLIAGGAYSLEVSTSRKAVSSRTASGDTVRIPGAASDNRQASEAYRQGCYYLENQTTRVLQSSIVHFQQAVSLDPGYAAAYAGMAECYVQLASRYDTTQEQRVGSVPRAREAAAQALQLNDQLPEAHGALGTVSLYLDSDFDGAEREYKRAIELNPGYAHGHHAYAILLFSAGRLEQAEGEIMRAAELDPLSVSIAKNLADGYYFVRQYGRAIEQYRRAAELDPTDSEVHRDLGWAYACNGMEAQAVTEFIHAMTLLNANPDLIAMVKQAYDRGGLKAFWRKWLEFQQGRIRSGLLDPSYIALIHAFLGDRKQALNWLERAAQDKSIDPATLKFEPILDSLRSDSRYEAVLAATGLR